MTELTLTGTMDASDFKYVAESFPQLASLDLSGVVVTEYSDKTPLFANFTLYPANVLPKYSLMGTSLETVVLPSSITEVGEGAFCGCAKLQQVAIPASVTKIEKYAFSGASALASVSGGEGVTEIADYAFSRDTLLTSVAAMPELTSIGAYAFYGDKRLASYEFKSNIQTIGECVFDHTALTAVDLSGSTQLDVVGAWAFADNSSLTTVSLPKQVTAIGDGAFFYSTALKQVVLPEAMTRINDYAFMGANEVETAVLPDGVTAIGDYAFSDWTSMQQFLLPSSVESVGTRVMRNWTALTALTSEAVTPPSLGEAVWEGVNVDNVTLTVPDASEMAYKSADQWKEFFNSAVESVTNDNDFRIITEGDRITVRSSQAISLAQLFDISGILLQSATPAATETSFSLAGYGAKVYAVRCKLADGKEKIVKISRK